MALHIKRTSPTSARILTTALMVLAMVVQPLVALNIPSAFAVAPVDGILINEFSSESSTDWVELFNTTSDTISLNGWKLEDSSKGNSKIADLQGNIAGNGYLVFNVEDRLNKSGDIITLIHDNNNKSSIAYGNAVGKVVDAPGPGQSAGLIGSVWQILNTPTPGQANVANTPPAPVLNPVVTATNFNTHSGDDYKGMNVGFTLNNDFGTVSNVIVELHNASGLLVANTGTAALNDLINGGETSLSTPFFMQGGAPDTYWSFGSRTWTADKKPTKAVIKVTDEIGTKQAENSNLVEANGWTFASLVPGPLKNVEDNLYFNTIAEAIAASTTGAGETIQLSQDMYVPGQIAVNKQVTIDGQGHTLTVNGSGYRFLITASGATMENMAVVKTDTTGVQNIVGIQAANVTIDNVDFTGQYKAGDGEVSRALEVSGDNFTVKDSTFNHLRQPAYINGFSGAITNSHVAHTKGWVITGDSNVSFSGNTWGTGIDKNATDIAVIDNDGNASTPAVNNYTCEVMSQIIAANNSPTIDNQLLPLLSCDKTAPSVPTLLTPVNRGYSNTNNFYFDWSDSTDDNAVTYEFQSSQNAHTTNGVLDTSVWKSGVLNTSTIHSTGAPDGDWYWQVRAIDAAGNKSAWTPIWKMTIDTNAPMTTLVTPNGLAGNTFTVSGVAKDNLSLNRVYVQLVNRENSQRYGGTTLYVSGMQQNWSRTFNASDLNLPEGTYAAHVSVVDNAGNSTSQGWSANFTLDRTAPVTSINVESPAGTGDVHYGAIRVTGIVTPEETMKSHWFEITNPDGSLAYSYNLNTANLSYGFDLDTSKGDGQYKLRYVATDKAGNRNDMNGSTVRTITVATPAPVVNGENFNTNDDANYKGLNVGFNIANFKNVSGVKVELFNGNTSMVANTHNDKLLALINGGEKNLSTPFITVPGTYTEETEEYWNLGAYNWLINRIAPTKAVVTVTGTNMRGEADTRYATLEGLTEPNGWTFASILPKASLVTIPAPRTDDSIDETDSTPTSTGGDNSTQSNSQGGISVANILGNAQVLPVVPFFGTIGGNVNTPEPDDSTNDENTEPAVLGNQDQEKGTPLEDTGKVAGVMDAKIFGLAWYWIVAILAGIVAGWLALAAMIRRRREAV